MDKPLRIGVASVFARWGFLFGARQLDKLTDIMKREKVDIVLLPGDLMDDTVDAYLKRKHETTFAEADCADGRFMPLWAIMTGSAIRSVSNMNWKLQA